MKLDLLNTENKKTDVQISESTFGKEFNETLVHQAVVTYLAGSRQGSHKQKTRSEVEEEAKSHIVKKALVEQELVQFEALYGEAAGLLLQQHQEIIPKKSIRKCIGLLLALYSRNFIDKIVW